MNILRRRRKVLNIGGGEGGGRGKVQNIGGGGQRAKLYAGRKLIGAPARPQSVPKRYISHAEN